MIAETFDRAVDLAPPATSLDKFSVYTATDPLDLIVELLAVFR